MDFAIFELQSLGEFCAWLEGDGVRGFPAGEFDFRCVIHAAGGIGQRGIGGKIQGGFCGWLLGEQGSIREIAGHAEAEKIELVFGSIETPASHLAIGGRAEPSAAANTARAAIRLVPTPLGDIAAHVINPEFVRLFRSDRGGAATVNQILTGCGGIFPIPCHGVDILAAAEAPALRPFGQFGGSICIQFLPAADGGPDGLYSAARGPFPLDFGGETVAIRFGVCDGGGNA